MTSFKEAVETCMIKKFATISGRATRAEYWWFQLFIWGTMFLLCLLSGIGGESTLWIGASLAGIFYIICLIPNFCVGIRRLHDTGHSGYYILCGLIPYVGSIILFIASLSDSEGDNEYGPVPNRIDYENKENSKSVETGKGLENVDSSNDEFDKEKEEKGIQTKIYKEDESRFMPPVANPPTIEEVEEGGIKEEVAN